MERIPVLPATFPPKKFNSPALVSLKIPKERVLAGIECFHVTSRQPYWCPKTMQRRPCWCPKPTLWELNSFLMQTLSVVLINLHIYWPRE